MINALIVVAVNMYSCRKNAWFDFVTSVVLVVSLTSSSVGQCLFKI